MIDNNLKKVNSYKNYKTRGIVNGREEELFIEINLYEKDPTQKHHWRSDVARPAAEIDLE